MKNIFNKLEKIVEDNLKNEDINILIQEDMNLFNYKDLEDIKDVWNIFENIKVIYKQSIMWLGKNVSYIETIERMMKNKEIFDKKTTNIYGDLFLEVESIISFLKMSFKPTSELIMQFDYQYHYYKSLFLYLFSIFDTMSCLLCLHYCKGDELSNEKLRNIKFYKSNSYLMFNNIIVNKNLKNEIDSLIYSNSFQLILSVRNSLYHQFENPILRYHLSTNIMMCFITITRLIEIIKNNLQYYNYSINVSRKK